MTICLNTLILNTHQPSHTHTPNIPTSYHTHPYSNQLLHTSLPIKVMTMYNSQIWCAHWLTNQTLHSWSPCILSYIWALCSVHHKNLAQLSWSSSTGSCDTGADCYYQVRALSMGLRALPANVCLMCTSNWEKRLCGFHVDTVLPPSWTISFSCHNESVTESVI